MPYPELLTQITKAFSSFLTRTIQKNLLFKLMECESKGKVPSGIQQNLNIFDLIIAKRES